MSNCDFFLSFRLFNVNSSMENNETDLLVMTQSQTQLLAVNRLLRRKLMKLKYVESLFIVNLYESC